jgi:hypothetical protein
VAALACTLVPALAPVFGFLRLIDAARVHALDPYPLVICATLSGKHRYAPVPDIKADPGYRAIKDGNAKMASEAPSAVIVPSIPAQQSLSTAEDDDESGEQG